MGLSSKDFHRQLFEKVLDLLWSQWTALGTFTSVPPYEAAVIDPEALICATMWFGRYSPGLFDEAMDWMNVNDAFVSLDRLKSISKCFSTETRAVLGAVSDYLWKAEGKVKFRNKSSRWKKDRLKKDESLFRSWPGSGKSAGGRRDEVFLQWGLERGPVGLRAMSTNPPLENPANLRFLLRDLFGIGIRAEVATYLLLVGRGNSWQVARAVNQNQRAVYSVLDDFARGGFAHRREAGRETVFSIDIERWSNFVELEERLKYIQWAKVFSALQVVLTDRVENEEAYGSPFLASSRFRDISPQVARKLSEGRASTLPPEPRKYIGEEYKDAFITYLEGVLDELTGSVDQVTY